MDNTALVADLVAAYAFEEGAGTFTLDNSGNGHDGTLENGVDWGVGQFGTALDFDGNQSAKVSLGTTLDVDFPLTFTAWVYQRDYDDWRAIFAKRDASGGATTRFQVVSQKNTGHVALYNGGPVDIFDSTSIPLDTWTHVALVLASPTDRRLYLDGTLVQQKTTFFDLGPALGCDGHHRQHRR